MGERRIRRTYYTSRGRLANFRARHTNIRASEPINENEPLHDPDRLEFYSMLSARMSERILGESYMVAP